MKKHRIAVVEDHPLMLGALASLLDRQPDLQFVGSANTIQSIIQLLGKERIDILLVDLVLPDGHGLELIGKLNREQPRLRTIAISVRSEKQYAARALKAGARGYIEKSCSAEEILERIRRVISGNFGISEQVESIQNLEVQRSMDMGVDPFNSLSKRELIVFEYMGRGLRTREIAEKLNISRKTVDTYIDRLRRKLAVAHTRALAQLAHDWVEETSK